MSERNLLIGAIVVLVLLASGFGVYSKFKDTISSSAKPSPSPNELIFGNPNQQQTQQQNQQSQSSKPAKQPKQYSQFPGVLASSELKDKKAVIQTNKGKIEFEVYPEASKAASNFIFLAKDGFYDSLTFHRVVPNFVIQGGDPLGTGEGGPGYKFEDEPVTRAYDKGIVAMANAGPNTNGSQFFIMLADNKTLSPSYTIFGKVISGQEVVDKIQVGDTMAKVTIEPLK